MRVDYHVHPNLPARHPEHRLRLFWEAFGRHRLDAIVCAEHTFKDAPRAYRLLKSAQPKHSRTHVFPGAELVAKDHPRGIDVIAFGDHDWYDEHPRLLRPFSMTLDEMIRYLERTDLRFFIPHPLLTGTTLKRTFDSREDVVDFLGEIPAYEAFNGCHLLLEHLCAAPALRPFFGAFGKRLRAAAHPPLSFPDQRHAFLAVGSDAHHPREIGFSVEIPGPLPRSSRDAFDRLTHNTDLTTLHFPRFSHVGPRLLSMLLTTLHEGRMRRTFESDPAVPKKNRTEPAAEEVLA
jgi:hypothetical protein